MKFSAKKFNRGILENFEPLKKHVDSWFNSSRLNSNIVFKTDDYYREINLISLVSDYLIRVVKAKLNNPEITSQQYVIITAKQMNQVRQKYLDFYDWESNQSFLRMLKRKKEKQY